MRLALATNHLGLGGSESYLLTVAEELDRLGHHVVIYTREPGAGAAVAHGRGIEVVDDLDATGELDAALAQDAGTSHDLASRHPALPQLFVAHSETFDLQLPPQLESQVETVVALNDRVVRRLEALAGELNIVRLRQPIGIERAVPSPLPDVPRRALLLSNNLLADRLPLLEHACAEAGLELSRVGGDAGEVDEPRAALGSVEIVIGRGRSILEAMASGRAAYVYDRHGGDGWVTAETYAGLEADGFAGRVADAVIDPARLGADLRSYSPSMGAVNRDLAVAHHRANVHAQQLVGLFRRLVPQRRSPAPHEEMARLARLEWRAQVEAQGLRRELVRMQGEIEARVREARRAEAEQVRRNYETTLSWRAARPLRSARALVGRLRRRSGQARKSSAPSTGPTESP
jgi:hypothetical protein